MSVKIAISNVLMTRKALMYLVDTNVLSEIRKKNNTNIGVTKFFKVAIKNRDQLYLPVITIGELRRGVELIRHSNIISAKLKTYHIAS